MLCLCCAYAVPVLCRCFAYAVPMLCLCYAYALPMLCLCCACTAHTVGVARAFLNPGKQPSCMHRACTVHALCMHRASHQVSSPTHLPRCLRDAPAAFAAEGLWPLPRGGTLLGAPSDTSYEGRCVPCCVCYM